MPHAEFERLRVHLLGKSLHAPRVVARQRAGHVVDAVDQQHLQQLAPRIDLARPEPELHRLHLRVALLHPHFLTEIAGFDDDQRRQELLRARGRALFIRVFLVKHMPGHGVRHKDGLRARPGRLPGGIELRGDRLGRRVGIWRGMPGFSFRGGPRRRNHRRQQSGNNSKAYQFADHR